MLSRKENKRKKNNKTFGRCEILLLKLELQNNYTVYIHEHSVYNEQLKTIHKQENYLNS